MDKREGANQYTLEVRFTCTKFLEVKKNNNNKKQMKYKK